MKRRYFLSGAAILLLLASSCKKEDVAPLNPTQFAGPPSAQSSPVFSKTYGGSDDDIGMSAAKSTDGYVIAGGTYSTEGDFSGNRGILDGWLVKIDRHGSLVWQKLYGGTDHDRFHSIAANKDGGYIMAGATESDDGDVSGYHGGNVPDAWVVKTDASGNILWSKAFGSSGPEIANSVMESSDGNYIVVGKWDVKGYVIKLDHSGNLLWEKILDEGSFFNEFTSILEDSDGNYIATGFANKKGSGNDFWLVKLNKNGEVLMHRQYGGPTSEYAFSATIAQDGAYILAGQRLNRDENRNDVMLIKVNQEGTCLWERILKTPDEESASSIIALENGGYLIAKNTTLAPLTEFGSWLKVDDRGNKLEEQKVAEKTHLSFIVKGTDNSFITGGWQYGNPDLPNTIDMIVVGLLVP